jgi:hypothetical protein
MWIEDLTKALWMLNGSTAKWSCCIAKIVDNVIIFTDGSRQTVQELVAQYDKEYHPTR